DRTVGRRALGHDGAAAADVQAAAGEGLDEAVRRVPRLAAAAAGRGQREVEDGRVRRRVQRAVHAGDEGVDLGLQGRRVAAGQAGGLGLELREAPLRRIRAAVELRLRLGDALAELHRIGLRRVLAGAAEQCLDLVGDALLLARRALVQDGRGVPRIQ